MVNSSFDAKTGLVTISFKYEPGKKYPASKSGKTSIVATTSGFTGVPNAGGLKISLNATDVAAGE